MSAVLQAARPARAPIRWFGGKHYLRRHILPYLAGGQVYVEPYGGAGSILFAKDPHPVEVYNDLNDALVILMRALQDPTHFAALKHRLTYTLYSRAEFCLALETLKSPDAAPVERAWAMFVAHNQGFSGQAETPGDWGRTFVSAAGIARNCWSWQTRLGELDRWHARLARVQIDNRDALTVIRYWDSPKTLFYLDPPYLMATRKSGGYTHELSDRDHQALRDTLADLKGQAVLSGYAHPLYEPLGWRRVDIKTSSHAAGRVRGSGLTGVGTATAKAPRTECLWISPGIGARGSLL